MSTWSRSAFLVGMLVLSSAKAAAETDVSEAAPEPAATAPVAELLLQRQDIEKRTAALVAREDRMVIWEEDLTRRAQGEQYFSDLDGYVTAGELVRAVLFTVLLSAVVAVGVLMVAVRKGIVGGQSQAADELRHLEDRVRTGLREFDGLLTRLYDRILTDVSRSDGMGDAEPDVPQTEPAAPGANGNAFGGTRQNVLALARDGIEADEIGRRLQLGPGEVNFILRMETGR